MAKDLVRTRHSITKFYALKSQLQGVSLRMQTLKSTQAMGDAMRGVTRAMKSMNTQLNLPSLNNILKEFEKQNEKMDMTTEVMGDAIDDAFAGEDEEEEKGNKEVIIIDELPYQVNKKNLLEKIAELVNDKKLEGISDLRDESDKDGMRYFKIHFI